MRLEESIRRIMEKYPEGIKARTLAKKINVDKKELNSYLYKNKDKLFAMDEQWNWTTIENKETKHNILENELLYYITPHINAVGYEKENGVFVVLRGSKVNCKERITSSYVIKKLREMYKEIIDSTGRLGEDITFKSANEAACFCYYGSTSATMVWKNEQGDTLRKIRKEREKKNEIIEESCDIVNEKSRIQLEVKEHDIGKKSGAGQDKILKHVIEEKSGTNVNMVETVAYYEIYNLLPEQFANVDILTLDFSVRLEKRLLIKEITTVEKLLHMNDKVLGEIKGFGAGCYKELHLYLKSLNNQMSEKNLKTTHSLPLELEQYRNLIKEQDFSFVEMEKLSDNSLKYIERLKVAFDNVDGELVQSIYSDNHEIINIVRMLQTFCASIENNRECREVTKIMNVNLLNKQVSLIIKTYTDNEEYKKYLTSLMQEDETLEMYVTSNYINAKDNVIFRNFIKWCQYNLRLETQKFFDELLTTERKRTVLFARSEGKALQFIAESFKEPVTRERVRQIEQKLFANVEKWIKRTKILNRIFLELDEDTILSADEIATYIGEYGYVLVYVLKNIDMDDILYDKQLDMFVLENLSLPEKVQSYVESLPDILTQKEYQEIFDAIGDTGYPEKMVEATINDNYKKTGETYHRSRLSLTNMYYDVMQRFYPSGMHIYDPEEIAKFKELVFKEYGINIFDKSDHAIGSVLARIGILCNRGVYKARENKNYISKHLAAQIYEYIEKSSSPIFMTNTLFSLFEEELLKENVDNKYYLQGILRDLYDKNWYFKRDYISKDQSCTSLYSSIVDYIKNAKDSVSKEELHREFPGVTEIVLNFAIGDHDILNLFGQYIHSNKLSLLNSEIAYLNEVVESFLSKKGFCHCKEIYNYIVQDNPSILKKNYINFAFSLFSVLEYIFVETYNFSRPYIAKKGIVIEKATDVLREIVRENEIMEIVEIQEFAKENHVVVYNVRELIDSFNDTHLLINDMQIASIEYIGITESKAREIEDTILLDITETTAIHQLHNWKNLPTVNVEWNVWLIYSILKRWSTKLEVGVSNAQFRQAYPLVAPIGKYYFKEEFCQNSNVSSSLYMPDDLDNIDDLLEDMIEDIDF